MIRFIKKIIGNWKLKIGHRSSVIGHRKCGFTLAELLISMAILSGLLTLASITFFNILESMNDVKANNLVYDEARFAMQRITREIRNGTVDYEEYYNQNQTEITKVLGQNYCNYSRQFYLPGTDGQFDTYDDQKIGIRNPSTVAAISSPIQEKLYLIDITGTKRTYLKRGVDNGIGRIYMVKLNGVDYGFDHKKDTNDGGEGDGLIDTWICADGFTCKKENGVEEVIDDITKSTTSFVPITPTALNILDIKFIIAPQDDPRKAFNDTTLQIQPHITIKMVVEANKSNQILDDTTGTPNLTLVSTISSRAYSEIVTECNRSECKFGADADIACPLTEGVCAGTTQSCSEAGVWPGCSTQNYLDHNSNYEEGSEIKSCENSDNPTTCIQTKCEDGLDNDCDGKKDFEDEDCVQAVCNDGTRTTDSEGDYIEDCTDVGGVCDSIRPKLDEENTEFICMDGYDNDCNDAEENGTHKVGTGADEFDENCINIICSNGKQDSGFIKKDYSPTNYLLDADPDPNRGDFDKDLNETTIDTGGICSSATVGDESDCTWKEVGKDGEIEGANTPQERRERCSDGTDNDCDGKADEFDEDCWGIICSNNTLDCSLAKKDYEPKDYLKEYVDEDTPACRDLVARTDEQNDEITKDIGGICDGVIQKKKVVIDGSEIVKYVDHSYLQGGEAQIPNYSPNYIVGTYDEDGTIVNLIEEITLEGQSDLAISCRDNLDNDADGDLDWEDEDCCPNQDNDGWDEDGNFPTDPDLIVTKFLGEGPTCFLPDDLEGKAMKDCNDFSALIRPENPNDFDAENPPTVLDNEYHREVCNNLRYPTSVTCGSDGRCTFPSDFDQENLRGEGFYEKLKGQYIDDNCSAINNWTSSESDTNDPACCVDMDGDGFGQEEFFIYADVNKRHSETGNVLCGFSAPTFNIDQPEQWQWDCDDMNEDISPFATEVCDDVDVNGYPVNNNCKRKEVTYGTSSPVTETVLRANGINWYKDKNLDWFMDYASEIMGFSLDTGKLNSSGGIATAYELQLFDPSCCTGTAIEICGDGLDNNCNGLKDGDDNNCIASDKLSFTDYFGNTSYVDTTSTTATYSSLNKSYTATADGQEVYSLPAPLDKNSCTNVATANITATSEGSITFEVSRDGGENWVDPSDLSSKPNGNDLRWRAIMENGARINSVTISFTCN